MLRESHGNRGIRDDDDVACLGKPRRKRRNQRELFHTPADRGLYTLGVAGEKAEERNGSIADMRSLGREGLQFAVVHSCVGPNWIPQKLTRIATAAWSVFCTVTGERIPA